MSDPYEQVTWILRDLRGIKNNLEVLTLLPCTMFVMSTKHHLSIYASQEFRVHASLSTFCLLQVLLNQL